MTEWKSNRVLVTIKYDESLAALADAENQCYYVVSFAVCVLFNQTQF